MCTWCHCLISKIVIMRILYILHSTLPTSGATKAILGLVALLETMGVKPIFIVPNTDGIYQVLKKRDWEVYAVLFKMSIYPPTAGIKAKLLFIPKVICRFGINVRALMKIRKLVIVNQPDIIHTNTSVVSLGRIVARWTHTPHIQHIREYGDHNFGISYLPSWQSIHKAFKRENTCNICITKAIRAHHELADAKNARIVYDGVHQPMKSMPLIHKEPYWLYAGRIEYGKGLDILLEAYADYVNSVETPLPLHVAGDVADTVYYESIQQFIDMHQLNNKVVFLGNITEIEQLMQKAKALIIPSRSEGFGFCMVEAMFNGCLCLGLYSSGTKEQMENGIERTGHEIALPFTNTKELTTLLIKVHRCNDSVWDNMLKAAFETVNSLYTFDNTATAVTSIYKEIMKHRTTSKA